MKKHLLCEHYNGILKNIYNHLKISNKNAKLGILDETVIFKDLLKYLQTC